MRTFAEKPKLPQPATQPAISNWESFGQSSKVASVLRWQPTVGNQAGSPVLQAKPGDVAPTDEVKASTLRRKPDPAALEAPVPDPQTVEDFKPDFDYAWQNPVLRKTVFPWREGAFRSFLLTEKEVDLRAELAGSGFTADIATDIGAEILAERQSVTAERAETVRLRKQAEVDLKAAQTATQKHLAEPEVREQAKKKRALEEQRKRLAKNADAQKARIAELEKKGDKIGAGEQRELDKRHGMLDDLNAELATATQSLDEVGGPFDAALSPLTSAEAQLKSDLAGDKKKEASLQEQLSRVAGGVDAKKKASREAAVKWRLHEFAVRIQGMEHDDLLGLVLDEFALDKDFTRFPLQLRYLIVHFSGMRYASAHNTFGPPQELLATLKEQEVREHFAAADSETVGEEAAATGSAIATELQAKDLGSRRKTELLAVQKGLVLPTAPALANNKVEKQALEDLEAARRSRTEAVEQDDAAAIEELDQRIQGLEKKIGTRRLKEIGNRLVDAEHRRLKTLLDFRVREAQREMNGLSDLEALSLLQGMKDKFPDWVWHEVVRRTQLRVNVTDPKWDEATAGKKDPKDDPATAHWKKILAGWPRESGVWNAKHLEEYKIVATSVVCNQLAEQAQHLFGKDTAQGIPGGARWYHARAAEAKDKGLSGPDAPFFIRPTKKEDFVIGSSIFWIHFEPKEPYKENLAHHLAGFDFFTEGNQVMRDGLVEGDWTYHVDPSSGDITRTRGQDKTAETQWFAWQHEATVFSHSDSEVTTFETSAGARIHHWTLRSLVDPMKEPWIQKQHGDTNVFLGFAPAGKTLPHLEKALQNILPGRDAL